MLKPTNNEDSSMKKDEHALSRRSFIKSNMILAGSAFLPLNAISGNNMQDRPNILWITSEDNSPFLGCYGDPLAWRWLYALLEPPSN